VWRWCGSDSSNDALTGKYECGMTERLANRIKEKRSELGLTQAELAERCGVTRKTVNTVENGIFVPSTLLALKLAKSLSVPIEELFSIES
jgi:putative transcriptional regulator